METATAPIALSYQTITGVTSARGVQCGTDALSVPPFLAQRLQPGARIAQLGPETFVAEPRGARSLWLHAPIGYASQPKENKQGEWMVRAEVPNVPSGLKAVFVTGDALRQYFYRLGGSKTLYQILGCSPESTLESLRMAWRIRSLELRTQGEPGSAAALAERAFNVLANPDLRRCYDAFVGDEDAPPVFHPNAAPGSTSSRPQERTSPSPFPASGS